MKQLLSSYNQILFVIFWVGITNLYSQNITRDISKEISVTRDTKISINGPRSINPSGKGFINSRQSGDQYIVSSKNDKPYIYVINKTLDIQTWKANKIKQITTVNIKCKTRSQSNALLDALKVNLQEDENNVVSINCQLNISNFKINSSLFWADNNYIRLENGKEFQLIRLELTTTIFIPEWSDLNINTVLNNIILANHTGNINLNMKGGRFKSSSINNVTASVTNSHIKIAKLTDGIIEAKNTSITIDTALSLLLNTSMSSISLNTIKDLEVVESFNDNVEINKIEKLRLENSKFSTFYVTNISTSGLIKAKNTDIKIESIGTNTTEVKIENYNSKIELGLTALKDYRIVGKNADVNSYFIPDKLSKSPSKDNSMIISRGGIKKHTKIEINSTQCDVIINN